VKPKSAWTPEGLCHHERGNDFQYLAAMEIFETRKHENTKARNRSFGVMGLQFEELSGQVIGAALAVHKWLGPGFLESTYHSAMRVSLSHRTLPFESQLPFEIRFESVVVARVRIDLIVGDEIVVELKAVDRLRDIHFAQLKSYLRATKLRVGLLFNLNSPSLTIKRMVLD
jgi:GxxExxY protein